ncbi:MAG: Cupin 2 conserved barrel domain protein, partial [Chloroflexi bacterium]|nr:Cupin 2 conserved barrel domain protein [Chloroflexota bacterium]
VRYGQALAESLILQPGDFLFIPADMPHQPVNLSTRESALAIVARNDANEQESVEVFEESRSGRVMLTR